METHQLEIKVQGIIKRIESGQPIEDNLVELKREWPIKHENAAKQIAGLANAARGAPVLWVIGIDEAAQTVYGADHEELADWWPQVRKHFSELAPSMTLTVNVHANDQKTVVALLFDTDRAPYVIDKKQNGNSEFIVPWREGNSTRTAKRADLLKILSPLQKMPELEVLNGTLTYLSVGQNQNWHLTIYLFVDIYEGGLTVPQHRCKIFLTSPDLLEKNHMGKISFAERKDRRRVSNSLPANPTKIQPHLISLQNSEYLTINGHLERKVDETFLNADIEFTVKMQIKENDQPLVASGKLTPKKASSSNTLEASRRRSSEKLPHYDRSSQKYRWKYSSSS